MLSVRGGGTANDTRNQLPIVFHTIQKGEKEETTGLRTGNGEAINPKKIIVRGGGNRTAHGKVCKSKQ